MFVSIANQSPINCDTWFYNRGCWNTNAFSQFSDLHLRSAPYTVLLTSSFKSFFEGSILNLGGVIRCVNIGVEHKHDGSATNGDVRRMYIYTVGNSHGPVDFSDSHTLGEHGTPAVLGAWQTGIAPNIPAWRERVNGLNTNKSGNQKDLLWQFNWERNQAWIPNLVSEAMNNKPQISISDIHHCFIGMLSHWPWDPHDTSSRSMGPNPAPNVLFGCWDEPFHHHHLNFSLPSCYLT